MPDSLEQRAQAVNIELTATYGGPVRRQRVIERALRAERAASLEEYTTPHPMDEWHHDDGNVLWWRLPVQEPPYCGTPLDDDWIDDYYTHWTRLLLPEEQPHG